MTFQIISVVIGLISLWIAWLTLCRTTPVAGPDFGEEQRPSKTAAIIRKMKSRLKNKS
ncbi:hypothetical protein [Aquisalinus flavus]|uniref:hypothetical protein n=1 Tax=Aquisalinus flavus TaxID=1526572 RepID=UPI00165EFFA0|nr:hypothetical protein [Aquisalinus flavus]MBD0425488.1 hypothetical protein [Aquisalinus flavus]